MSLSEKTPAVYMVKNKINDRVYIGSTKDLAKRWKQYIHAVNKVTKNPDLHDSVHNELIHDIAEKGWDNFEFKILYAGDDMFDPFERAHKEIETIMKYRSIVPEYGYNSTMGGETGNIKNRKVANRKPKPVFLYDTKTGEISLYMLGTKSIPNIIHCKKDTFPDALCRGKLIKGRYFAFYADSDRRAQVTEYIKANREQLITNGKNQRIAKNNYELYKKALKLADEFAAELEM